MKKTKLLLATPLMVVPFVAALPLVTSCNKTKDLTISSEITEYADIEVVSEKLEVGEPYVITLSIKEDQIGKRFLPTYLTKVKSGDTELELIDEVSSNGLLDYYTYTPYYNNTVAVLTILSARGPISIEGETCTLSSIIATPLDIQYSNKAQFEVGETLTNYTDRVFVIGKLSNGDFFSLEGGYEVVLGDLTAGHKFTTDDITTESQTGTVKYRGKTASFTYDIIAAKQAYMIAVTSSGTAGTKYDTIQEAITAYNAATTEGYYTITIKSSDSPYVIEGDDGVITLNQKTGKRLTITADEDPYYEDGRLKYGVNLEYKPTAAAGEKSSLIKIAADSAATSTYINISGIEFTLDLTVGNKTNYGCVWLSSGTNTPCHDIYINNCKFNGTNTKSAAVYGVASPDSSVSGAPYNVFISSCYGYSLSNLYQGSINKSSDSDYSLIMSRCLVSDSDKLFTINSDDKTTNVLIDSVVAYLMYADDGESSTVDNAMTINGKGTFEFDSCVFNQIAAGKTATNDKGLIEVTYASASENEATVSLTDVIFNKLATDTKMHCAINNSQSELTGNYFTLKYNQTTKQIKKGEFWDAE